MYTVYSKNNCPSCAGAKQLLDSKGMGYTVVNCDEDPEKLMYLVQKGLRSVPQIFQGDQHIGGFQELQQYLKEQN